jgi:hypothetical protein
VGAQVILWYLTPIHVGSIACTMLPLTLLLLLLLPLLLMLLLLLLLWLLRQHRERVTACDGPCAVSMLRL